MRTTRELEKNTKIASTFSFLACFSLLIELPIETVVYCFYITRRHQYAKAIPNKLAAAVTSVSIVIDRENCNENYLKNFVSVYPKEVLATVLVENLRRFSREYLARV